MATSRREELLAALRSAEAAYLRLDAVCQEARAAYVAAADALDAAVRAAMEAGLTSRDIHEALRAVGGS